MEVVELSLGGLKLIKPPLFLDNRGYFSEIYKESLYFDRGIKVKFVQDNHSFSKKNVLRGMHFQLSPPQEKLIYVISGKIFDVAVDIRPNSSTFGKWEGVTLDDEKCYQLFIPLGFAHGFCVLSECAHVVYKVSNYYAPVNEKSFYYKDPKINIIWPVDNPILSEKDEKAPFFNELKL